MRRAPQLDIFKDGGSGRSIQFAMILNWEQCQGSWNRWACLGDTSRSSAPNRYKSGDLFPLPGLVLGRWWECRQPELPGHLVIQLGKLTGRIGQAIAHPLLYEHGLGRGEERDNFESERAGRGKTLHEHNRIGHMPKRPRLP